jgi:hypothetical protein
MRINNDLKIIGNIISHKPRKTKKITNKKLSLKIGYVEKNNIRYLKIEENNEKVLIKVKDNSLDINILSKNNYSFEKLKKALEKSGWKVNRIENKSKK